MSRSIKRNFKYLSLLAIIGTFSLVLLNFANAPATNNDDSMPSTPRKMLDTGIVDKICEKAPKYVSEFYTTQNYESKNDAPIEKNQYTDTLIEIIDSGDLMKVVSYIIRVVPFLFFIVMVIATIITWFVLCSCCCCPSCCCRQKENEECCRTVSFYVSLVMFGTVVCLSIYGFVGVSSMFEGMNGMMCAFMKLYYDIVNGQTIETIPKWNGITGIKGILGKAKGAIEEIEGNKAAVKAIKLPPILDFETVLNNQNNIIEVKKIDNKNPTLSTVLDIKPFYIEKYGDYKAANSFQEAIYEEYSKRIEEGTKMLKTGQDQALDLMDQPDMTSSIESVITTVDDLQGTFDSLDESIITPMDTYLGYIEQYGNLAFNILFGLFLGFGACIIGFVVPFVFLKTYWARIILHVFWHFFSFLTIIVFLLGSIFGLLGIVMIDVVGVFKYVISDDNLLSSNPLLLTGEALKYLQICINGDGDITKDMMPENSNEQMDTLYKLQADIAKVQQDLKANKNSFAITEIKTNILNPITNNFIAATEGTITNYGNDKFAKQLEDLNQLIKSTTGCTGNNKQDDIWVAEKSQCPTNYQYRLYDADFTKNKNCFVVIEYDDSKIRYVKCGSLSHDPSFYLGILKQYDEKHTALLKNVNDSLDTINTQFVSVTQELSNGITVIDEKVLTLLVNVFKEYVGESSVFSIVNCKFMGSYFNVLLDQLKTSFAQKFYDFAIVILTLSSCVYFGNIFLLVTITRFRINKKQDNKSEEEGDNNDEKKNEQGNTEICPMTNQDVKGGINPDVIHISHQENQ